ncbi:GNAT family N-acetyltransferase [Bacillus massilinigeriensis]|uniref:GNAT family N-acetyltransferase n=1 Tax=Bacillus massilionigeriensis TaxID=1805475 RepID=UPI00096AEB6C|nr:hypothetical protein [Bacillus massilionigeriensis]
METLVRGGKVEDVDKLIAFLNEARVGTEGVESGIEYFLIMEDKDGNIKATLGIEPLGSYGLLRSLVMTSVLKEQDILVMFEQILRLARERQLTTLYLATNKSKSLDFFQVIGFEKEETEELPKELMHSKHVQYILSVDNSVFMRLNL